MFSGGHHRCRCPSSLVKLPPPGIHSTHAAVEKVKIDVGNPDELFGDVLGVAAEMGRMRSLGT
jgi:hypothetical protein